MALTYPYLHYGCATAGLTDIAFRTDRLKKGARFLAFLLWPVLRFSTFRYLRKLRDYDQSVWEENKELVPVMNSMDMLASRSTIITACKPA
jgi:hypothetical protein